MRDIKFRGRKCQGGGIWVYGNCLMQDTAGTCYIANNIAPSKSEGNYVEVVSVCQAIGMKDCTGSDLYEGDIISSQESNNSIYVIMFDDTSCCFAAKLNYGKYCFCGLISKDWIDRTAQVIIGNIYDNPELLERKRRA